MAGGEKKRVSPIDSEMMRERASRAVAEQQAKVSSQGVGATNSSNQEAGENEKNPAICFHDIQGFNVSAKEIQIKNRRFSCKLIFNFYDHFGLDSRDIDKFGDNSLVGRGFQGWYILQHLYEYKTGCKAFVTHATHEETVEVEIEE